jgi:hypothetical protein
MLILELGIYAAIMLFLLLSSRALGGQLQWGLAAMAPLAATLARTQVRAAVCRTAQPCVVPRSRVSYRAAVCLTRSRVVPPYRMAALARVKCGLLGPRLLTGMHTIQLTGRAAAGRPPKRRPGESLSSTPLRLKGSRCKTACPC